MDGYVDLVPTKRGLAKALHSEEPAYAGFPAYHDQRLKPVLHALLAAAEATGEISFDTPPGELLDAVSRLCITAKPDQIARRKTHDRDPPRWAALRSAGELRALSGAEPLD